MDGQPRYDRIRELTEEQRPRMIECLEELVNMDSPSEDRALSERVGAVLRRRAEELGMTVSVDPQEAFADNLIARLGPPPSTALLRVLMIGHFDTVFAAGAASARPFRIKDGLAFGPGVLDMKGGLVIGSFALQGLLAMTDDLRLAVTLIMNSDEEPGSPRSRDLIQREAPGHDLALILEPGVPGPAVTVARKGVGIFRLHARGVEAHAGVEPGKGANAIVELAEKIIEVHRLADPALGTTVTPGVVRGGTKPYVVPGEAELTFDVRVQTVAERERILRELQRIVSSSTIPRVECTLSGSFHRPPMPRMPGATAYVSLLQDISRKVGLPLGAGSTGGASDGNLTAAAGVPTIDGMGAHGGRAHSPEEYMELDTFAPKCTVLTSFLVALNDGAVRPGPVRA